MAFNPVVTQYDENGVPVIGYRNAAIAAGASTTVVKTTKGRVAQVVVTSLGTTGGTVTIYDNTAGSGTKLLVIPEAQPIGTVYKVDMPATIGITVVNAANAPALTVSFS